MPRKSLLARAAAVAAALALALSGCAGGATADSAASSTPRAGGSLTIGIDDWCGAYDKQQTSGCTFSTSRSPTTSSTRTRRPGRSCRGSRRRGR
ncbi:hypothetical protein P9139_13895 [Curtobacterium flaccumfaciens]|nr:hypothetical protein P9139_13895 [Curtobacterium flaccumfaciens]